MAELTRRYVVMAMATEAPFDALDPEGVFVLRPWKDPAAVRALQAYRDNCYPELSRDLDAWIRAIEAGPTIRGDVGRRNDPHVAAAAKVRREGAAAQRQEGATTRRPEGAATRPRRSTGGATKAPSSRRPARASARRKVTKPKKRSR